LDIHEYQAKDLLSGYGVPIQRGSVAYSADQASFVASELGGWHWAVKAQIHSGARGKAGGIKLCRTYHEVHYKRNLRKHAARSRGERPSGGCRGSWIQMS
jgi:malate-CoA ligase subunit beta